MKVLVVDDSGVQRNLIMEMVRKSGFQGEFLEAADGNEAIDKVGRNYKDIKLVLTDLNMPNLNGCQFLEAIAKVPPLSKIPVAVLTIEGTQDKMDEVYAKHPGVVAYIKKPFTADQLKASISKFLK